MDDDLRTRDTTADNGVEVTETVFLLTIAAG